MALPRVDTFVGVVIGAVVLFLLPAFYAYSPTSCTVKLQSVLVIAGLATHKFFPTAVKFAFDAAQSWAAANPLTTIGITFVAVSTLRYLQQKLRYARLNRLKMKHGFTEDPDTFTDMTVEQAQEVEANLAEWEFPRLWQFAWVSDFVRTATDPGVSRALVKSGHMVNPDPMVEHERLQATIHLMSCFLGYPIKSRNHSLAVARINEHHHRYGSMINSDDILYLIIHLGFNPVNWVNRFGYRQLNAFEVHANWVLWREIGVRMGCKYMPVTVEQALKWKKNFEKQRRWRDPANKVAGMAMFNEIIYSVPALLKELTRQVVASVLDRDIVYFCQLEDLQPSAVIRGVAFDLFSVCAWSIRNFGLPRLNRYQRVPEGPNEETGLMDFLHTPYDTLPFYQAQSFWNMWGCGALIRRLRGIPLPGLKYHPGSTIEAMGLAQISSVSQATVEKKVVEKASELMGAPYGYRPAIGYQYGRLLPPVDGPEYGSLLHTYTEKTPIIPMGEERFDKQFERRAPGYSNLTTIEKPRDITAFDSSEHYGGNVNGIQCDTVPAINSAV